MSVNFIRKHVTRTAPSDLFVNHILVVVVGVVVGASFAFSINVFPFMSKTVEKLSTPYNQHTEWNQKSSLLSVALATQCLDNLAYVFT